MDRDNQQPDCNPPQSGSGVPRRSPFTTSEIIALYDASLISKREARKMLSLEEKE